MLYKFIERDGYPNLSWRFAQEISDLNMGLNLGDNRVFITVHKGTVAEGTLYNSLIFSQQFKRSTCIWDSVECCPVTALRKCFNMFLTDS